MNNNHPLSLARSHFHRSFLAAALLVLQNSYCSSAFSGNAVIHYSGFRAQRVSYPGQQTKSKGRILTSKTMSTCARDTVSALNSLSPSTIGAAVNGFYKGFPILAAFATCGIKGGLADRVVQWRDVSVTKFSIKRNLAMALYSGTVLGILCEITYNRIYPIIFGTEAKMARIVKMVLFDAFVGAPIIWLPPAYFMQALVQRYPQRDALKKYIKDVRENGLLTKYWSVWLPATSFNFSVVPTHFRIAFVAVVSFFWLLVLSFVSNKAQHTEP